MFCNKELKDFKLRSCVGPKLVCRQSRVEGGESRLVVVSVSCEESNLVSSSDGSTILIEHYFKYEWCRILVRS